MKDDRRILCGMQAVFLGYKVSLHHLDLSPRHALDRGIQIRRFTRSAHKAAQVRKTQVEQGSHNPGADEPIRTSDQNGIFAADDQIRFVHLAIS